MIKKKSIKLFIVTLLSISMITGIFARQKQEVDALALTIPVVAIPIIKMLIAGGLTFATTDAMIEAYNIYVQDTGMSTVTGAIRDQMQDYYQEITGSESVQDFLNKNFPGGQVPDPNDPEWNNYKNLILGTIGISIIDKFEDIKSWVSNRFTTGEKIYTDITMTLGINDINTSALSYPARINLGNGYYIRLLRTDGSNSVNVNIINPLGNSVFSATHYTNHPAPLRITTSFISNNYLRLVIRVNMHNAYYSEQTYNLLDLNKNNTNITNILTKTELPYKGEEILNDPTRKHINETTQKEEILMPLPLELVEYDDNQQKWVLNADKEIPIEQAKDMLKPLENKTYQDLTQETPQETNIPTENPTDPTEPTEPTEPEPEPTDLFGWLKKIWQSIVSFDTKMQEKIDSVIETITPTESEPEPEPEPEPDYTEQLTEKAEEIKDMIDDKLGIGPLKQSLLKIQQLKTDKGSPPIIKVNLKAMFQSTGKGNTTLPTDATFIDFAFMESDQWSYMGYNLIDLFRALVSMGFVFTTARYVWDRIIPDEVI